MPLEEACPRGSVGWAVETAKELTLESTLLPRGRPRQERYYAGMEFPQCRMASARLRAEFDRVQDGLKSILRD